MAEQQRFSLPRLYNRKILKALREFEMLDPGDRILVGFSGGERQRPSPLRPGGLGPLRGGGGGGGRSYCRPGDGTP